MTKTPRALKCVVVVLTSLTMGCAPNLPELPLDSANTPVPVTPVSPAAAVTKSAVKKSTNNVNTAQLEYVANDLVNALAYISGMGPELVSIRTTASDSVFESMVKKSMQQRGYRVSDRRFQSPDWHLTTSSSETSIESQLPELTAIIALNTVLIKRTYVMQGDSVKPVSSYVIRGIQPELVSSNDQVTVGI